MLTLYFITIKYIMDLDFIKKYPEEWYINTNNLTQKLQYLDKLYSYSYRKLLSLYNDTDKNKEIINTHILEKLKNSILIDLWCGSYECNLSALAYQSNALAYVGIDINANLECNSQQEWYKKFLEEQYNLSNNIKWNQTFMKTIMDNFEIFLEKAPDNGWYNFTINWLILTSSISSIKAHLNRIMLPGSIILANNVENINIKNVLLGPYKHTLIKNIFWNDSINIYEKLDSSIYWLNEIKESLTIVLEK